MYLVGEYSSTLCETQIQFFLPQRRRPTEFDQAAVKTGLSARPTAPHLGTNHESLTYCRIYAQHSKGGSPVNQAYPATAKAQEGACAQHNGE